MGTRRPTANRPSASWAVTAAVLAVRDLGEVGPIASQRVHWDPEAQAPGHWPGWSPVVGGRSEVQPPRQGVQSRGDPGQASTHSGVSAGEPVAGGLGDLGPSYVSEGLGVPVGDMWKAPCRSHALFREVWKPCPPSPWSTLPQFPCPPNPALYPRLGHTLPPACLEPGALPPPGPCAAPSAPWALWVPVGPEGEATGELAGGAP